MQVAPKLEIGEPDEPRGEALKRRTLNQDGPVGMTPNSADLKRKGRRHHQGEEDEKAQTQDTDMIARS